MSKYNSLQVLALFTIIMQQVQGFEFLDYTDDHLFNCHDEYKEKLKWLYIIICPLTLLATFFIIMTYIKYPGTRNSPGDLLFAISICEFALNLHWFISSIASFAQDGNIPDPDGAFCRINSIFSIPAGFLDFAYNFSLNIYVSLTLKNSLRRPPQTRIWHIIMCISAIIIVIIFETTDGWSGVSVFGTCSYTSNRMGYFSGPLIGIVYAFLGIYMFRQFHKDVGQVKNRQRLAEKRKQFSIYYTYVKITSCIYILMGFTNTMIGINCMSIHDPGLNIFLTITNFLKLLSPVILSFLRYRDPTLKNRIDLQIKQCLRRRDRNASRSLVEPVTLANNQQVNIDVNVNADLSASFIEDDQFTNLRQLLKTIHLRSMVNGIKQEFSDPTQFKFIKFQTKAITTQPNQEDYLESKEIILDNDSNNSLLDERFEKLSMRMTVYSPKIFQSMRQKDINTLNFVESLNEQSNHSKIVEATGEGKGGASGEFFYSTFDNNLLLKTINSDELSILLNKLDKFYDHYQEKPESLITKIYGVFTFQQLASYGGPQHIIVMRNLFGIENKYIERKYDLKGSQYQRHEQIKNKDKNLNELVLKDTDFQELEKSIKANHQKKTEISQILELDSNYLAGQGFMDYSLLVAKVDWNQYFLENPSRSSGNILQNEQEIVFNSRLHSQQSNLIPGLKEKVLERFGNTDQLFIFQSEENPYYLQQWTIKKSLERHFKNCINGKDVNTSAQPPRIYSDRFKNSIRKIFTNS